MGRMYRSLQRVCFVGTSQEFEESIQQLGTSAFGDQGQQLYTHIMAKHAWLNRDPTQGIPFTVHCGIATHLRCSFSPALWNTAFACPFRVASRAGEIGRISSVVQLLVVV